MSDSAESTEPEGRVIAETQTAGFGLANGKVVDRLLLAFDRETPAARIRRERVHHPDPARDGEVRRESRGTMVVNPHDTHHDRQKLEIGTSHGRDRLIAEWNEHAPRAYLRHERLEDDAWNRQAAWELHPVQGIEQVCDENQSEDGELVTDGGLVRVPYASKFLHPVVREDKDATLRRERYGLEAGDRFIAANEHSAVEWALCEVTYTFTCPAWAASQVLEHLNANHALTETNQTVVEVLQPHYDERVSRDDTVKGIVWKVVQPFAEVSDGVE